MWTERTHSREKISTENTCERLLNPRIVQLRESAASEDSTGAREEAVELPAALPALARGSFLTHSGARRHLR